MYLRVTDFYSFEQDKLVVTAYFMDRASGIRLPPQHADVLIGCDGIHSAVRSRLYPREGSPVSSGYIQWRGAVDGDPFLDGRTHATMGSSGRRAVVYPISKEAFNQGDTPHMNWVVVLASNRRLARRLLGTAKSPKIDFSTNSRIGIWAGSNSRTSSAIQMTFTSFPRRIAILCRAGALVALWRLSGTRLIQCARSALKQAVELW